MQPPVTYSIRVVWYRLITDLSICYSAIFCSTILPLSQYLSVQRCFHITVAIEVILLCLLVLLRNSKPSNTFVGNFCHGVRNLSVEALDGDRSDEEAPSLVRPEFARKGGGGLEAPENTLVAIRQAKRHGMIGVQVDLRVTCDGVIVLLHDEDVVRTTDGTGCVLKMSYEQIKKLNAAAKFKSHRVYYEHEPLPSLEDAIKLCFTLDINMLLELKDSSNEMINSLLLLYKKYSLLYQRSVVCSFSPWVLYKIRKYDSEIMTGLITRDNYLQWNYMCPQDPSWQKLCIILGDIVTTWSVYAWLWWFCGNSFVLLYKDTISQQVINYWKQRHLSIIVWTVNNKHQKFHTTQCIGVPVITDIS